MKLGKSPNLHDPSNPLPSLDSLIVIFIVYLGFRDHEMDLESNLFFPSQKWSDTYKKFLLFRLCDNGKIRYKVRKMKVSKCQTYPP